MEKDSTGILIILGIIAIALFGGVKNTNNGPIFGDQNTTRELSTNQKIADTQRQIEDLKAKLQIEEDKKTHSQYKDITGLSQVSRSTDPSREYITIKVDKKAVGAIPVTGWTLKSLITGIQVSIPKAAYLFFTGMINVEEDILLTGGDVMYLVTGIPPNGTSFKVNKCSGYLGQFQTFIPYLRNNCPKPRDEDLSGIPNTAINSDCLDYIESMSQCRIPTKSLPVNWGFECTNFIYEKINYPSCVNIHKNDSDFYQKEWRVYLKRSESIWKSKREIIILYDNLGMIVDTIKY